MRSNSTNRARSPWSRSAPYPALIRDVKTIARPYFARSKHAAKGWPRSPRRNQSQSRFSTYSNNHSYHIQRAKGHCLQHESRGEVIHHQTSDFRGMGRNNEISGGEMAYKLIGSVAAFRRIMQYGGARRDFYRTIGPYRPPSPKRLAPGEAPGTRRSHRPSGG